MSYIATTTGSFGFLHHTSVSGLKFNDPGHRPGSAPDVGVRDFGRSSELLVDMGVSIVMGVPKIDGL